MRFFYPKMKYSWLHTYFLVLFTLLSSTSVTIAADVVVFNEDGLLSISAKESRFEEIFEKISEKFNISIKVYPEMKDIRISVNFQKLPLAKGVKKLVKENYAFVTRGNNIERIYILNRGGTFRKRNILVNKLINNKFPELDELKEVVTWNVRKEHPKAKFYDCIPHKHLDGKLLSYVFTYYIGSGNAPKRKILENEIMNAWGKKKIAIQEIEEGYKMRDSAKISVALASSREASAKISQENNFVSLEIGSDYTAPPVIAAWNGLPIDISQYPRALDTAHERIGDKNPAFKCVYTTGLFASVFAFEGDDKTYYIEPDNWQIFTSWKKVGKDFRYEGKNDEERRKNELKWESFLDI